MRVLAVDVNPDGLAELEGRRLSRPSSPTSPIRPFAPRSATGPTARTISSTPPASSLIKPIFDVTVEDWRRVQTVNAEATFFLCQKIGPRLAAGGAIVNLSSSSAKLATTVEVAAYAASKTTILSITRSFAYALASRPVRVNAILPGHRRHADAGSGAGDGRADARHSRPTSGATREASWCRSGAARRRTSAPG